VNTSRAIRRTAAHLTRSPRLAHATTFSPKRGGPSSARTGRSMKRQRQKRRGRDERVRDLLEATPGSLGFTDFFRNVTCVEAFTSPASSVPRSRRAVPRRSRAERLRTHSCCRSASSPTESQRATVVFSLGTRMTRMRPRASGETSR
jgi:hypothetical protein